MKNICIATGMSVFLLAGCVTEAEKACNEVTTAFCQKITACVPSTAQEKCVEDFGERLDCSKAEDVPDDFEKCVPAIMSLSCSQLQNVFPASCNISIRK